MWVVAKTVPDLLPYRFGNKKCGVSSADLFRSFHDTPHGRSVIIGLGKVQSYQWFASRQQEVLSPSIFKTNTLKIMYDLLQHVSLFSNQDF